ncbi:MAG: 4Fe-4S binding protein [Ignisphaera sp.]|nr:4Fe-4S binding protein [Ignisphaera sp.]MDW8085984.1 4Fe-4S binding protein [Ignisphaera sp.]
MADKVLSLEKLNRLKIHEFKILPEICRVCGVCIKTCPYQAVIDRGREPPVIDRTKCDCCGLCYAVCPYNAIVFTNVSGGG